MANRSDLFEGLRVLVVEDEGLIAEELGDRLSRMGMTVVATVDSADMAVASAIALRPDLVLMDIRIKGDRDGVQAANEINLTVDVPIVYLTAHSDRATLDRAKETSPFGYILKPFQERELLIAVEMAVHRHSLERQLKESERKYVATLASIGDAVIATDVQGHVTFMNPVAEGLTGWSFDDARGLAVDDVFQVARDVTGAVAISPIGQALRENRSIRFDDAELFLFSKQQETIPIDDSAAPIVDDRGRVTGGVVAFRDIRDRRLAEEALRVAQDELFQSQKMESVGRLASGIAHDFNNLLTVINGCGDLALGNEGLDDGTRELLGEIVEAGGRAAALTQQFLAFGRKQMLRRRVVDLTALVVDMAAMLRRIIGDDVQLKPISIPPQPIFVLADASQLEQVIVNLAVNARDAMPHGGAITIALARMTIDANTPQRAGAEPGRYAVLTVADTGRGIQESTKERIFEPYFSTKEFGKGSGLGLATVYGIVKQSGGVIEVDSEAGLGSTFRIFMPLFDELAPSDESVGVADASLAQRGEETILLVEDSESVRTMLATVLRREGYTVIAASDGDVALEEFARHRDAIRLVISDVVMPGMRGPALVERLLSSSTHVGVLFMSGYESDAALFTPGAAFIMKPFTAGALVAKVRRLLDARVD
ncbi:MAG: response regulator [bacterium]